MSRATALRVLMSYMTGYVVFGIMFLGGLAAYAFVSRPLAELGEIAIAEFAEAEKEASEKEASEKEASETIRTDDEKNS